MIQEFAIWLNSTPLRYWIVAWLSFVVCLFSAALPRSGDNRIRHWNSPIIFALSLFLMLLAFRWPGLRLNFQLTNPDESEMIAGAIAYRHYGTLWGHVTNGTVGPLIALPIIIPTVFGLPFDYSTARFVGLVFNWAILVFVWLTLRRIQGDRYSRLMILPLACWMAFTTFSDFVQYSTEPPALAYVICALWILIPTFSSSGQMISRPRLAIGGLILGVLPLAKPQIAPIGLVIGLWTIGRLILPAAGQKGHRWRGAACLIGGTLLAQFGLLISLWSSNEFSFFWQSYIVGNFHYAGARTYAWTDFPHVFWSLARPDSTYVMYLVPAWGLLAMAIPFWPRLSLGMRQHVALSGMLLIFAFFAIIAPGRPFFHYLQILPPFLTLFIGAIYGGLLIEPHLPRRRRLLVLLFYLTLGLGPQISLRLTERNPYLGPWQEGRKTQHAQYASTVARWVAPFVRKGDTMAVWGWAPMLHVELGLPQATRKINSVQEMLLGPETSNLRELYLAELKDNRPAIFIDAVNSSTFNSADGRMFQPHEINPLVSDYVTESYSLVGNIANTRIYIRRDRLNAP